MLDISPDGPLNRALAVLEFVATQKKAVSIAEIASELGLPAPTAHRLIGNLEERGLLRRALRSKRFMLGNQMLLLAAKAIGAGFRTARRHAVLLDVAREIGEQCEIGVVRDNAVTYVDSVRAAPSAGLQFDPGQNVPIHCTSTGKIYMSRLAPKPRQTLVRSLNLEPFTENTIATAEALLAEIERTRKRGWAKSNEEFVKGVVGCAVPIFGPDDDILIACLGISVPVARVSFDALDDIIPRLQAAATRLSRAIIEDESDDTSEAADLNPAA
ncbi:MAG: IclR family transcriptional regulator, acetate operon repressor [Hyphomicrobiales bacterium]|jgi:DNA-binding IclR family transcriptional regulator